MEPKMYRNVLFNLDRNHVHHFYSQCPPIRAHQVFLNKEWSKFRTQVTSHRMGLSALISSFIQFNRHKIVSTFALNIPPHIVAGGIGPPGVISNCWLGVGELCAGIAVTQNWSEGREGCINSVTTRGLPSCKHLPSKHLYTPTQPYRYLFTQCISLKYGLNVVGSRRSHVFGLIINKTDGSGESRLRSRKPLPGEVSSRKTRSRFSPSGSNFRSLLRKCGSMMAHLARASRYVNYLWFEPENHMQF